jgi:hypothetical protein
MVVDLVKLESGKELLKRFGTSWKFYVFSNKRFGMHIFTRQKER